MKNEKEYKIKDINKINDLLYHTENIFTNRINFFFVAESMIFVSYFSIIDKIRPNNYFIIFKFLIPSFGILVTLLWIYVNLKSYSLLGFLKKTVLDYDEDIGYIQKKKPIKFIPSNMVIGIFLPILILLLWSILLLIAVFILLAQYLGI